MEKVLFVIPAYNEEDNIEKVLKEIKKEISFADILVVNDCSIDNTAKIVRKNGIKCIDNVFNMKYAMAVQTGLKYAKYHSYDYVIQFDADGQHIASEAKKLLNKAKKDHCDIVIGSRYLKNTGYHHLLMRRIGTKMFEILIKIFCHQKITDPLSGFQCINKRVIDKYSEIGGYPEYPDANLIIEMLMQGYKIKEVPVKMRLRENGKSMHSGVIKSVKYMVEQFYTCLIIVIKNIGKRREK